jgi:hypothetical protein
LPSRRLFACRHESFGNIQQQCRKKMEQIDEHRVAPSISNFYIRLTNNVIIWMFLCSLVEQFAVASERERIYLATRAMNHFWDLHCSRANIPRKGDCSIDNIITGNKIHNRFSISAHGTKQSFRETREKSNVTAVS